MSDLFQVVLIDSDPSGHPAVRAALATSGIEVVVTTTAADTLAVLQQERPSLLALDVEMAEPEGFALLRTVRADPVASDLPVLALTGATSDADVAEALSLGADDFLRKPVRATEFHARVVAQLRVHSYLEELARRERDTRVMLDLTQALASATDVRSVLVNAVRRMAEVAGVERCSIVLVGEDGRRGWVVATSDDPTVENLRIELAKYPEIREALSSREVVFVDDAATHPLLEEVRAGIPGDALSLALLPIVFEERAMGVLVLRDRQPLALREHEVSLARTIANAIGISLRNARMLQSLQERTRQMSVAHVEAERRLRALEQYADFFHSAADGIAVADEAWDLLFVNPRARELLGLPAGDAPDRDASFNLAKLFDPREAERLAELRGGFAAGIYPTLVDLQLRPRGTERRVLSVSFGRLPEETAGAVLVNFRDVTLDRATATELTKTKEFLERVIASSADAIISADTAGVVLLFNRAAERVLRRRAEDVIGKLNVRQIYPDGEAHAVMGLIRSPDHGGEGRLEGHRTEVVDASGARVPVLLSAALVFEDGRVAGTVGIFTDLRDRLGMEAQLSAAQEELRAREAEAIVAELAGAAAHELNQPLTTVLGYAEMLARRTDEGSPLKRAAETIAQEAARMAEIVRKIGKITRYETKSYVGSTKILDLDRSAAEAELAGLTATRDSPKPDSTRRLPPLPPVWTKE